jgi:hypothetical protein
MWLATRDQKVEIRDGVCYTEPEEKKQSARGQPFCTHRFCQKRGMMTAIPASLVQAFQQLLPLTGLLWYIDQQGVPSCLIKVPHGVHFSDLSVILYTPRELYLSLQAGHSQERMRLVLSYGTQIAPGQPYSKQIHMFNSSSLEERNLLTRLAQASHVLLIGYSSDPDPLYLGSKGTHENNLILEKRYGIL